MSLSQVHFLHDELALALFEAGVVQVNVAKPFLLSSGETAPIYLDHRRIFSHPQLRHNVVAAWSEWLRAALPKHINPEDVVFAGTATAGIAPAFALAEAWNAGFVYVRGTAKKHGLTRLVEGDLPAGAALIVVDDMVTTGGSLLQALENVRGSGSEILLATALTTHDFAAATSAFSNARTSLVTLFRSRDLFRAVCEAGRILSADWKVVDSWIASKQ